MAAAKKKPEVLEDAGGDVIELKSPPDEEVLQALYRQKSARVEQLEVELVRLQLVSQELVSNSDG